METLYTIFARSIGAAIDVDWLAGGNMSFEPKVRLATGGFDPNFTGDNSYKEVDHASRVRKVGYHLRFVPAAELLHLSAPRSAGVAVRDGEHPQRRFSATRNGTDFYLKNLGLQRAFVRPFILQKMWGLTAYAVRYPSVAAWSRCLATLLAYPAEAWAWAGYLIKRAALAACRRSMPMRKLMAACSVCHSDAYYIRHNKAFSPTGC